MTSERPIEPLLDDWLADGPTQVSDRVIDDLATRIAHQPQRPAWRLRSWRFPSMAPQIRLVGLVAAAVVAALAGVIVLSGGGRGPTPVPSATPSASPSTTPSATAFECYGGTTGCAGPLAAGSHSTTSFARPFQFEVAPGWVNVRDIPRTYGLEITGATEGRVPPIEVMSMIAIADQTTGACEPIVKAGVGSNVDDLIGYVRSHPGLVATAPVPATLDGYHGQQIDFTIAPTWRQICESVDAFVPAVLMLTDTATPPGRAIAYVAGSRVRWVILDVGGETVVVEYVDDAVAPDFEDAVGRAKVVVDTIHFLPVS